MLTMDHNFSCCLLDRVQKGVKRKVYPECWYHKMACSMVYSKSLLMNVVKTFPIKIRSQVWLPHFSCPFCEGYNAKSTSLLNHHKKRRHPAEWAKQQAERKAKQTRRYQYAKSAQPKIWLHFPLKFPMCGTFTCFGTCFEQLSMLSNWNYNWN